MARYTVVVDRAADWRWPANGLSLMSVDEFLEVGGDLPDGHRLVNLCRRYSYLSAGYYCSLLAEARGLLPMPTVADVLALSRRSLYEFALPELDQRLSRTLRRLSDAPTQPFPLDVFFGRPADRRFRRLAEECFDIFRFPILRLHIEPGDGAGIAAIESLGIHCIGADRSEQFLSSLHSYTRSRRKPAAGPQPALYSLAILHEPEERLPPSDEGALARFERAGQGLRMDIERITRKDYRRLSEFDALFLRATTSIDHYTYRFARKAEQEGMVVIDDAPSILRCTNKVYLHELLARHSLPAPHTMTLDRLGFDEEAVTRLEQAIGYPMVLKIPDGSFSRGMRKAENRVQFAAGARELFQRSRLILAQEFMYTRFDWRVGVLGGEALYLCQYKMSRSHWQILDHRADGSFREGGFRTLSLDDAPAGLLELAVRAAGLIGDGLYGVDIKQTEAGFHVIEVNDNPSIDHGVEDKVLQDRLYATILQEFIRRIRARTH